jgi:hypothetical protein
MIDKLQKINKELNEIYSYFNKQKTNPSYSELIEFNQIYNKIQAINKLIN